MYFCSMGLSDDSDELSVDFSFFTVMVPIFCAVTTDVKHIKAVKSIHSAFAISDQYPSLSLSSCRDILLTSKRLT